MNSPSLRMASRVICWVGIAANTLFAYVFLMKPDWQLYQEIFLYGTTFEQTLWLLIVWSMFPIAAAVRYVSKG